MAWGYYLNLEPIAIKAAWDAVGSMTDSNELEDLPDFPDIDAFYLNLQYGYTAIVMGFSFLECSINTILRHIYGYGPDSDIMFAKIEDKLNRVMIGQQDAYKRIRGSFCWKCFRDAERVRNSLVHYKNNKADQMSSVAPLGAWEIGNQTAGDFFTRSSIEKCLNGLVTLVEEIAASLGLNIAEGLSPIIPDASGAPVNFIFRSDEFPEDWDVIKEDIIEEDNWRLRPMQK